MCYSPLIEPISADGKYYGEEENQNFHTLSPGHIDKWLWNRNQADKKVSSIVFSSLSAVRLKGKGGKVKSHNTKGVYGSVKLSRCESFISCVPTQKMHIFI